MAPFYNTILACGQDDMPRPCCLASENRYQTLPDLRHYILPASLVA
jgi:hypothetical protein